MKNTNRKARMITTAISSGPNGPKKKVGYNFALSKLCFDIEIIFLRAPYFSFNNIF